MAVNLGIYEFPFAIEDLPDRDRAVLAMILTTGSSEQREAIAGPHAEIYVSYAKSLYDFAVGLDIAEPAEPFDSTLKRAQYLAEAARRAIENEFPDLNFEVVRRAGNLCAFLNR